MQLIPGVPYTKLTKHWFKTKSGWNIRQRLTWKSVYRFSRPHVGWLPTHIDLR